jgi:hypothetical protein
MSLGPWHIFKGVMDAATYRAHFLKSDYSLEKILFHEGLGVQTIVFILPAIFLALPLAIKKRISLDWLKVYLLILPIMLLLVFRFVIPLANIRYLYPLLGIGLIIGFFTADLLKVKRRALNILVIICGLASLAELAKKEELFISICLSALIFFILLIFSRRILILLKFNKNIVFTFCMIAFIIVSLKILEVYYIKNEFSGYSRAQRYSGFWPDAIEAWGWLNNNTCGNNIAYAGRPVPFPLYGSQLKNNVFYVSVNKIDPAKLHYFPVVITDGVMNLRRSIRAWRKGGITALQAIMLTGF